MMRAISLVIAAAVLFIIGATSANAMPFGAVAAVNIQGFAFVPATRTINVGDSVTWTNLDQAVHSAKATGGSFDTGLISNEQSKTVTFNTAGTFAYICGVHGASMSGTIVVVAQATPAPTPVPTAPPTPQPTAPPTPRPTAPPTPQPTPEPTAPPASASPSASVAPASTATSSPAASPTTVAAAPSPERTTTPVATAESGPTPLLIAGAAVLIIGLAGAAFVLSRR